MGEAAVQDSTYAPCSNRASFERNVSLLMRARKACIESPLVWSKTAQTSKSADRVVGSHGTDDEPPGSVHDHEHDRTERARDNLSETSDDTLRAEAVVFASALADRLPPKAHDNLMVLLDGYASAQIIAPPSPPSYGTRHIYNPLKKCVGPHIHLIASDLVDFFGIDVVVHHQTPPESQRYDGTEEVGGTGSCDGDPRIRKSWTEWRSNREALVEASVASYDAYHKLHQVFTNDAKREKAIRAQEGRDEMELDSIIDQVKLNWEQKEENAANAELKVRKRINLTFQCTMLNDRFGPFSRTDSANRTYRRLPPGNSVSGVCPDLLPLLPSTSTTILVDNLPIDITEDEIRSLYSRCGRVHSVRIFNLRPDLDPGELTPQQLKTKRKKTRLSGAQATKRRGRQITPVHAMVRFEDEDGYRAATIDILCIFGMVIRRHPANSMPAHGLDSLYIENLPGGTSLDLLEKLNDVFHPNMFLFLDIGSTIGAQPTNCTLRFPSFEVADYAHRLLEEADWGSDGCIINWMKTPKDAMRYWRRENIDP